MEDLCCKKQGRKEALREGGKREGRSEGRKDGAEEERKERRKRRRRVQTKEENVPMSVAALVLLPLHCFPLHILLDSFVSLYSVVCHILPLSGYQHWPICSSWILQ